MAPVLKLKLRAGVAERVGFEPTRPLRAYTRSRRAPSTTRPSLRYTKCEAARTIRIRASEATCARQMCALTAGRIGHKTLALNKQASP